MELKSYLFKNLYRSQEINSIRSRAGKVVNALFEHYFDNFDTIPALFLENKYYLKIKNSKHRKLNLLGDFIASMTDKEALETFDRISM